MTRDDIRRAAATNLAAVLTQQLGLQTASGSPAGTQVLIEGLGDQRVLVLLDGQPVAGRVGGVFDLSRLPASIVDRIEVVKGPQSVLYGTDAMGGVINVITRRPQERTVSARAQGGNRGSVEGDLFGSHAKGPFAGSLGAAFLETDGYTLVSEEQRGPVDVNAVHPDVPLSALKVQKVRRAADPGARTAPGRRSL